MRGRRMPAPGCLAMLAWLPGACAAPLRGPEAASALQVSRTVDLSHVIREDSPTPPGDTVPRLFRGPTGELLHLRLGANTGSLVRVVAAAGAELDTVERLSPRDLVLPAVLIDAREQAQDTPGFALSAEDVRSWERVHGPIAPGTPVLLATGWDVRWGDPGAYLVLAPDRVPRVPGFGADAADLLLNQRGVAGPGVDAPGRRYTPARGFALLLENLTSLEQLPPSGATVVIGALKLQAAHAAPARVLALVP